MILNYHSLTADDKINLGLFIGIPLAVIALIILVVVFVWTYCQHKIKGIVKTKRDPLPVVSYYNNTHSVNTA